MSVYRRKNRPTWYYDFERNGARFHGSTGETEKGKAQAKERELIVAAERAIRDGHAGSPAGSAARGVFNIDSRGVSTDGNTRPALAWNAAAERYYQEKAQHEASAATTDGHLADLVRLLGPDTCLHDTDDAALATFAATRRAEKSKRAPRDHAPSCRCEACALSPATVNRQIELARRVMKRARKTWKVRVPAEWPDFAAHRLPEPDERVREASYGEEDAILAALRPDLRDLAVAAAIAGLRRANLVTLTWPQVDFDNRVIRYMAKSRRRKGGVRRVVPMTRALEILLRRQQGHDPMRVWTYVAQRSRGGRDPARRRVKGRRYPLTVQGWDRVWRAALKAAGVTDFRWHDWRHTAATRQLRATGNLGGVQKLLGHASIASTARYAHVLIDDLRDDMEAAARPPRIVAAGDDAPPEPTDREAREG